jgi:dUTP pyrophosphatase
MRNDNICVKWKKLHPLAKLPTKNNTSDAGYDVYSVDELTIPPKSSARINCGLQLAYITDGYWLGARSRSGLAFKNDVVSFHGTIDCGYRGELGLKLFNFSESEYKINIGDRVCQLVVVEQIDSDMQFIDDETSVHETIRGADGFGSSGK